MAHFVTELEEFDEHLISEEQILQASGETRLEAVSQLIIRGQAATGLQAQCAARLAGHLSVLSLSNNALQSVQSLHSLVNMVELNLNFNAISSLAELACPSLRRLFLSSNRLISLTGISSFPKLVTLCLYRNQLADLSAALSALRQLLKLKELDLDGNPCSSDATYKHQILRSLPKLAQLDGEAVSSLDTDLSQLYYAECSEHEQTDAATVTTDRSRILRCERLNDDPILLSYLADETLENPHTAHTTALQASSSSNTTDHAVAASSRGFVARLRSTGAMPLTEATAVVQAGSSSDAPPAATAVQSPPPLPQPPVGGSSAASDPSNPHATIRRLLQLVELLQRERDEAYAGTGMVATSNSNSSSAVRNANNSDARYYNDVAGSSDSDSADSSGSEAAAASASAKAQRVQKRSSSRQSVHSREVVNVAALLQKAQRLRLENQNMGVLLEENRSLRTELAVVKTNSAVQCEVLVAQVTQLQLQLAEATDSLQAAAADVAADVALGGDTPRSCLSGAALAAEVRLINFVYNKQSDCLDEPESSALSYCTVAISSTLCHSMLILYMMT
jgi:hypothetical protein